MSVGLSGRTEMDWQSSGYCSAKHLLDGVGGVADARVLATPSETAEGGGLVASMHTEGDDGGRLEANVKFCVSGKGTQYYSETCF